MKWDAQICQYCGKNRALGNHKACSVQRKKDTAESRKSAPLAPKRATRHERYDWYK